MAKKPEASNKTYVLELKSGDTRKITVPGHWKLTFGNVVPYQGKGTANPHEHRVALRLYDGSKENLRAVYTDVVSFRDSDIKTLEKRTMVQRKAEQRHTAQGARDVIVEASITEWVDPDNEQPSAIPAEFTRIGRVKNDNDDDGTF